MNRDFVLYICITAAYLFLAFQPLNAKASLLSCSEFLIQKPNSFVQWLPALKAIENPIFDPLTAKMKTLLRQHPIWQKYQHLSDDTNLQFVFSFPDGKYLESGTILSGSKGESIQTHFVAATLTELFPLAKIYGEPQPNKKVIEIEIEDPIEQGYSSMKGYVYKWGQRNKHYLSMPILKKANGRVVRKTRAQLRNEMGIPQDKKILDLYNFNLSEMNISELLNLLKRNSDLIDLSKTILIYTDRYINTPVDGGAIRLVLSKKIDPPIYLLSELTSEMIIGPGPHLIINDTNGLMPVIHRMADLTLIGGPVNIFESINSGTPTIFQGNLYNNGEGFYFDPVVYASLARTAILSGGGFPYNSINEIEDAIGKALQSKQPISPVYLLHDRGKTWFDHYLYYLQSILDLELL